MGPGFLALQTRDLSLFHVHEHPDSALALADRVPEADDHPGAVFHVWEGDWE